MLETSKDRISARVPKPVRETLEEAAALSGATLNQFVVQAALKEAHAVLERERIIRLSRRMQRCSSRPSKSLRLPMHG